MVTMSPLVGHESNRRSASEPVRVEVGAVEDPTRSSDQLTIQIPGQLPGQIQENY